MKLSIEKTKRILISKNPTGCKLSVDGVEMSADRNLTQDVRQGDTNIWLPAGDHLAERIYVNQIQNKNLRNLYASHTDLCSRDPGETTVQVRRNESFKSL
jgi:hypothetical protein